MSDVDPAATEAPQDATPVDYDDDGTADGYLAETADGITYAVLDTDGDQAYHTVLVDTDDDGRADTAGYDTDSDGRIDTVAVDTDDDGTANVVAVDTDRDGRLDAAVVDTDGDGRVDEVYRDVDGDGSWEQQGSRRQDPPTQDLLRPERRPGPDQRLTARYPGRVRVRAARLPPAHPPSPDRRRCAWHPDR